MIEPRSKPSLLRRAAREPVVHFAAIAALLFGVTEIVDSRRQAVIEIDPREVEWRIQQVERGRGAVLSDDERKLAERAYIDEQILAREARIRGFDDDQRIRSILSQKMLHILSGGVIQPSEAELRAYYEENRTRYSRPAAITADEVVVKAGRYGTLTAGPSDSQPAELPAELASGLNPETLAGDGNFEHTTLTGVTMNDLSLAFGDETAARIFDAEAGEWVGPHRSVRGELWFRVTERLEPGIPPSFESILGQVRFDWIGEREEALLQERLVELRERYSVTFVDGGSRR